MITLVRRKSERLNHDPTRTSRNTAQSHAELSDVKINDDVKKKKKKKKKKKQSVSRLGNLPKLEGQVSKDLCDDILGTIGVNFTVQTGRMPTGNGRAFQERVGTKRISRRAR